VIVYVYLVQHGEAAPKDVDPERPLTDRGREEVADVAALASRLDLEVARIRHSGKTRAEQTAAVLAEAMAPVEGVEAASGLAPNDAVAPVAEALASAPRPLMLVGHLPFLGRLAGVLVCGDPERPPVRFRNAAIVCLARDAGLWQVAWILTPEMARVTRLQRSPPSPP
jgi:phosphohistidine phosphatase